MDRKKKKKSKPRVITFFWTAVFPPGSALQPQHDGCIQLAAGTCSDITAGSDFALFTQLQSIKGLSESTSGPVLLTFTEAVSQASLPRQQGLLTVEAQQGGLGQAEDGQSKCHTFVPLSHLQAADLLQCGAQPLLVTLHFVRLVFKNQQDEAVWSSRCTKEGKKKQKNITVLLRPCWKSKPKCH